MISPVAVDLREYDVIVVNSSAGKDSQATLHYVATLAEAFGVLDRVHVVHAELEEEWAGTKELVAEHAAAYGVPFHVMKRPQGSLLAQIEKRGMWPSSTTRYCTSDHKRGQVSKVIVDLARRAYRGRAVRVLNCLGIRRQESSARAKKSPFERDARQSNARKIVDTWFPIFELSVADVWAVNRIAGTRHHPAYDLGMPRLSCCFCVFAPKAALMLAGRHNPDLLQRYVDVERRIGHTFRQDLKIADVQAALAAGDPCGPVQTWEM